MKIHQLSAAEALASLGSDAAGLSAAAAAQRRREGGANRVEPLRRAPLALRLLREFTHLFSAILWVAAGLAFLAEWQAPGEGMGRIGAAIVVVIIASGLFSFWQEYAAERTLAALQRMLPQRARVLRDGEVADLPAEELVPGDVILVDVGDGVPADCRLLDGFGLRISNATITGESVPLARSVDASAQEDPQRAANLLLAGTAVVAGQGRAVVFATGAATEFGRITRLSERSGEERSPLRWELGRLSRTIAALSVSVGLALFVVGYLAGLPFWQDFLFAIGIIVAMVPEGLLTTLTVALVLAAQRMARRGVLVRQLTAVEALGAATVICTDKTGTLTQNRMQVRELFLGGVHHRAGPAAMAQLAPRHPDFFRAAALCHALRDPGHGGRPVGDPMDLALFDMAHAAAQDGARFPRLAELPFDSERMRQSVVHAMPEGPVLFCKGAPQSVLPLCDATADRAAILRAEEAMTGRGLRVVALAARRLTPAQASAPREEDLTFLGLTGLDDPPREGVRAAIDTCRAAGIRVIMFTGDHPRTAAAIAREVGVVRSAQPLVLDGEALRALGAPELAAALLAPEIVFARVTPDQKLRIVEALKAQDHIVAVTGDGVNDAPALRSAHIGIAMGIAGTEVAREAADIVLLDDSFAGIVAAVEEGRAVFANTRRFLTYVLVHNVAELVPFLAYALLPIPLPLTPLQALYVDMATDSLTALGLAVELPDPKVMQAPPRARHERLLSLAVALRGYLFLGAIEAVAAMAAFFFVLGSGGWEWGGVLASDDPLYRQATTACLAAIGVLQLVNVYSCRDATRSAFRTGLFDNRVIAAGVGLAVLLILVAVYTPAGHALLGTAPLPAAVWLFILPFAVAMLALEEGRKWLVRRRAARRVTRPACAAGP